jgi:hypothetical protein
VQPVAKQALASAVILSSVLMLAAAYYWPIQDPHYSLNTDWNGSSRIAASTPNVTIVSAYVTTELKGPALLAIVGPAVEFSRQDARQIQSFMDSNGTVLLADDFGTGNSLLQLLNVSVRISGEPIADLAYYSKGPGFPLITDFSPSPLTINVTVLVLNHPSYLETGNTSAATMLAYSSPFSFIDASGTGIPASNETIEPYPVIAQVRIGRGSLIIVSDADLFTNEMLDVDGNMRLFDNALRFGDGPLFFDEAHLRKAAFTDARIALKNYVKGIGSFMERYPAAEFIPVVVIASVMMVALLRMRRRVKSSTLAS